MSDHYETLGVSHTATKEEIKKAYRALAKRYHPDRPDGDAEKFREVDAAYKVLSDDNKRKEYDSPFSKVFGGSGADDFLNAFWRSGFKKDDWGEKTYRWHTVHEAPKVGATIHHDLNLSFEEMCQGCTKMFTVIRRVVCPECKGVGGEDLQTCRFCGGKGQSDSRYDDCGVCNGKGKVPKKTCMKCAGSGYAPKEQKVSLKLPAGIEANSHCDLPGIGHEMLGGKSGNLMIRIRVRRHQFFSRSGLDVHCILKVNALRAILGGDVVVPTLHGDRTITILPGTQNNHMAVLEGEGIHTPKGKGNQCVKMKIVIPSLSHEEKTALTEVLLAKLEAHKPDAELEPLKEALRW